jgi:hypothetical protein
MMIRPEPFKIIQCERENRAVKGHRCGKAAWKLQLRVKDGAGI